MYSFTNKPFPEKHPLADEFGVALKECFRTLEELEEAKRKVPNYTAQWDEKDYYRDEEAANIVATNRILEIFDKMIKDVNND